LSRLRLLRDPDSFPALGSIIVHGQPAASYGGDG